MVSAKINQKVNVFLLSEGQEGRIINKCVDIIDRELDPAMRSVMSGPYVDLVKLLLQDNLPPMQKKQQAEQMVKSQLKMALTNSLNQRIDLPILGEGYEQQILAGVVDEVLEQLVDRTVDGLHSSQFCIAR